MKKRVIAAILAAVMVAGLTACGGAGNTGSSAGSSSAGSSSSSASSSSASSSTGSDKAASGKKIEIKVGYGTNPGHPIDLGSIEFEKTVEAKAKELGYDVDVQLFPSAQLGSEKEMVEQLQMGTLDMCPTTTGPLGNFDPKWLVFDLPYLFLSNEQADKVLDGEIGTEALSWMEGQGIIGLAWWENGFRELTNNKREITKPDDLKGIKLRTMENDVHIDYFSTMGASPTPLGFGEIYTSLQSSVIDGQENPISIIATNKFYEVQPYTTISDHVYSPVPVLYSKACWDKLPADLQEVVKTAAFEVREYERKSGREQNQQYIDEVSGKSQVYTLSEDEKKAFQEVAQGTWKKFEDKIGKDLMDKMIAAVK